MKPRTTRLRLAAFCAAGMVAACLAVAQTVSADPSASGPQPAPLHTAASGKYLKVLPDAAHTGHGMATLPLLLKPHDTMDGRPQAAGTTPTGYSPAQLRAYLGLTGDGAGQHVAVVDAYDHPFMTDDLNTYSKQFNLPQVCGTTGAGKNCFDFTISHPDGFAGIDPGWGIETALDVETIHAIAPKASIELTEAFDSTLEALLSAIDHAASDKPDAISNSWGINGDEFSGETEFDTHCRLASSLCVFATGDSGNPGFWPSTDPDVLAVGGTTLTIGTGGSVTSETAWSLSGGGISPIEPKPAYQDTVNDSGFRGIPDISFNADPLTGVAVYSSEASSGNGHWWQVGGTSAGAPAWAAILTVTDQLRADAGKKPLTARDSEAQKAIYAVKDGHGLADITEGNNGFVSLCGPQCAAGPGYDYVTGLGSPRPGIDTAMAAAP